MVQERSRRLSWKPICPTSSPRCALPSTATSAPWCRTTSRRSTRCFATTPAPSASAAPKIFRLRGDHGVSRRALAGRPGAHAREDRHHHLWPRFGRLDAVPPRHHAGQSRPADADLGTLSRRLVRRRRPCQRDRGGVKFHRPHPEERALARVSKDGPMHYRLWPSFETRPSDAPPDEVAGTFFRVEPPSPTGLLESPMSDPEIDAIRAILTSRPRPSGLAERRDRLDGLGRHYPTPADIRLEPVTANGVPAEWSTSPTADPGARSCSSTAAATSPARSKATATGDRDRARGRRAHPCARLSPRAGASVSRGAGRHLSGYRYLLEQGIAPQPHRDRRRQRRRRAHRRADGRRARPRAAAAVMRLVHLAVGRSRERRRHAWRPRRRSIR